MSAATVADDRYADARTALQAGNPSLALEHIAQARSLYLSQGSVLSALRTDLGRINVLDDLGRHHEAIEVGCRMIAELAATDAADDPELRLWLEAAANENTGATHGCVGLHAQAVEYLTEAERAYAELGALDDGARVQANLGVERLELGQPQAALELLRSAHAKLHRAGEPDLARRCLVYAARATAIAGDVGAALELLESAKMPAGGPVGDIDDLRLAIARAEVFEVLHLWPEVLAETDDLLRRTSEADMQRDLAAVLIVRARAQLGAGDRDGAQSNAQRAVALLDDLALDVQAARATITLVETSEGDRLAAQLEVAYELLASVNEKWAMAEAAVLGAERATTSDAIATWLGRAETAGVSNFPELCWRDRALRGELARAAGDTSTAETHLADSLRVLRSVRNSVGVDEHKIRYMGERRSPLESLVGLAIDRGDLGVARQLSSAERAWTLLDGADQIAASPPVGTVLYQSIAGRLGAFVTVSEGVDEYVELDATVEDVGVARRELLAHWRRIADPRMRVHLDRLREAADQSLQSQYLRFLEPIDRLVPDEMPLRIIPTASLAGLPFNAFHDGLSYLIERRQVHIVAHEGQTPHIDVGNGATLVVGVADHAAPSIEREASSIAEITGATLLMNRQANAAAVREAIAAHQVVHLACHGRFRPENPALSAVRLADRWVGAGEIASWDLQGKVVVLAACSTGVQQPRGEDSALGLPRSVLHAGAAAAVMNLWPADDEVSVGMMTQFHGALGELGPRAALRHAQLVSADNHPHPLLWGATTVFGPEGSTPSISFERNQP